VKDCKLRGRVEVSRTERRYVATLSLIDEKGKNVISRYEVSSPPSEEELETVDRFIFRDVEKVTKLRCHASDEETRNVVKEALKYICPRACK